MSGFDASAFLGGDVSPAVAAPAPAAATAAAGAAAPEMAESRDVWRAKGGSVAGVATVAGIEELPLDLPFAADLNAMLFFPRPDAWMPRAWAFFLKSAFHFVQSGKCAEALELGWEPIELFGCYGKPWAVYRLPGATCGVVMGLKGCKAGQVSADRIEVVSRHKPYMHFYRAHFMSLRGQSVMMWDALDVRRWPEDGVLIV